MDEKTERPKVKETSRKACYNSETGEFYQSSVIEIMREELERLRKED
jgi:hypothetical protein